MMSLASGMVQELILCPGLRGSGPHRWPDLVSTSRVWSIASMIFSQFLDIQYKIVDGVLVTDLYKKPTDANRYLHYNSFHPRHMFRSIVFSQALRYRRIINVDSLLEERLEQLKSYFVDSAYPVSMVEGVIEEVKLKPRNLNYRENVESAKDNTVSWIVTYGPGFEEAK